MYFQNYTTTTQPFIPSNQWAKRQYKAKAPNPKPFKQQPRTLAKQQLLIAVCKMLKARALEVGLGEEADQLIDKLMQRRS